MLINLDPSHRVNKMLEHVQNCWVPGWESGGGGGVHGEKITEHDH
jgi:hypothetical protein